MRFTILIATVATLTFAAPFAAEQGAPNAGQGHNIQLGPRPFFLVNDMAEGN